MGSNLGIWSKHIYLACTVLYFGVLEKMRLYSQGEGHCPITTNIRPQGETNQFIHRGGSRGGTWGPELPYIFRVDHQAFIIYQVS